MKLIILIVIGIAVEYSDAGGVQSTNQHYEEFEVGNKNQNSKSKPDYTITKYKISQAEWDILKMQVNAAKQRQKGYEQLHGDDSVNRINENNQPYQNRDDNLRINDKETKIEINNVELNKQQTKLHTEEKNEERHETIDVDGNRAERVNNQPDNSRVINREASSKISNAEMNKPQTQLDLEKDITKRERYEEINGVDRDERVNDNKDIDKKQIAIDVKVNDNNAVNKFDEESRLLLDEKKEVRLYNAVDNDRYSAINIMKKNTINTNVNKIDEELRPLLDEKEEIRLYNAVENDRYSAINIMKKNSINAY